jgi:hypothetical protein
MNESQVRPRSVQSNFATTIIDHQNSTSQQILKVLDHQSTRSSQGVRELNVITVYVIIVIASKVRMLQVKSTHGDNLWCAVLEIVCVVLTV